MRAAIAVAALGVSVVACGGEEVRLPAGVHDAIFVAVEPEGRIAVIDGETGEPIGSVEVGRYTLHNVQADPDLKTVWATAMPASDPDGHAHDATEELVGVDVQALRVRTRIPLGEDLHVAHVVVHGRRAWVSATDADALLEVDLDARRVGRTLALPPGTRPHGLRLTPDGRRAIVAGMGTPGSLVVVSLDTGAVEAHPLPGRAVQTGVLRDGTMAFASIFDTRQVARLDLITGELLLWDLPSGSAGPLQVYPTPDSASLWVADQGILDGRPVGSQLLRFDVASGTVDARATVALGPHGVVSDASGEKIWMTSLFDGVVQSIDARTADVLSYAYVGAEPNGITCWHRDGVMP